MPPASRGQRKLILLSAISDDGACDAHQVADGFTDEHVAAAIRFAPKADSQYLKIKKADRCCRKRHLAGLFLYPRSRHRAFFVRRKSF
jgi:hypothetical protein